MEKGFQKIRLPVVIRAEQNRNGSIQVHNQLAGNGSKPGNRDRLESR